jgi:hypothetical protein
MHALPGNRNAAAGRAARDRDAERRARRERIEAIEELKQLVSVAEFAALAGIPTLGSGAMIC